MLTLLTMLTLLKMLKLLTFFDNVEILLILEIFTTISVIIEIDVWFSNLSSAADLHHQMVHAEKQSKQEFICNISREENFH